MKETLITSIYFYISEYREFFWEVMVVSQQSLTCIINSLVCVFEDDAAHRVHALTKTVMHFEELGIEVVEVRYTASILHHFRMVEFKPQI